jgi:serine/threonine-protein kinase
MAVEAGTRLGRFVVHEYLGRGTLGTVYRALEPDAGSVVVKVLHRLAEPEMLARFEEAAPSLAGARHPNLVAVLEHGEHDGTPYLIEEFVQGETLAERYRQATMSPAAALALLRGVAAGIDHAHARGIVHGNLKPQQVLLRGDGRPVVTDFGLAPLRRPHLEGLTVGVSDGTPEYLAPEQVAGSAPTAASDRYAFATIAYQLLVDRTPFEGEAQSVMDAQLDSEPLAPSQRNRALPAEADEVLLRGLAREPADRWPACAQLVDALALALGLAPEAGGSAGGGAAGRALWAIAAGGAALLVLCGASAAVWITNQPRPAAVVLSRTTVAAGESVGISASHLPANQVAAVELGGRASRIGVLRADQSGNAAGQVELPGDAGPGDQLVSLCWNGACAASARLTVTKAPVRVSRAH